MKVLVCVGCLLVTAATAMAAGEPTADSILRNEPEELVRRLRANRAVILGDVGAANPEGFFLAYVVFEQSTSRVYRLLAQTARQSEFRPEIRSIETVETRDDAYVDEHHLRVMFIDIAYRLRYRLEPVRRQIRWELDSRFDNDLERIEGFWELYELEEGRTLGRFGTVVNIGGVLPEFLQAWVTRRNLPTMIQNCRKWVDSGGTFRP